MAMARLGILGRVDRLTLDELDERWVDVERAVDATPGVDRWCSGPDWQLPVGQGFAPDAPRLLLADDRLGFALLARYREAGTDVIGGVEPLWGFASPLVGPDPGALANAVAAVLADDPNWTRLVLPGLPPIRRPRRARPTDRGRRNGPASAAAPDGPAPLGDGDRTTLPLAVGLSSLGRVGFGTGITRRLIDLTGGFDCWLDRRSPKFRRNLRRAVRRADDLGVVIEDAADDPALFDRILAIEHRSWKGREGSGITGPGMTVMYRTMIDRLRVRGRLLANVATLDGVDVGYIVGGVRARRYRGLQLSYTDDLASVPDLSIGNVLQANHLALLTERGLADHYDLGMDFDYKRRWADRAEPSVVLVVQR